MNSERLQSNERFPDLLRDPATGFVHRENLSTADGNNHRPLAPDLDPSFARAISVPTAQTDYGTTGELFSSVEAQFAQHGFAKEVSLPSTHFAFSTWFLDCLPAAPCLLIAGPRPEANFLLDLLACMVRNGLRCGQFSRAEFCSLPTDLGLTLLIGDDRLSTKTTDILTYSNNREAFVPSPGGIVNTYCAKALYRGSTIGIGIDDCALHITVTPFRERAPFVAPQTLKQIAGNLQPKFLAYRTSVFDKVAASDFDLSAFDSTTRVLARVLGASIVDAPDLQAGIGTLLEARHEAVRANRWLDFRCVVIESMFFLVHAGSGDRIHIGEIARSANGILQGRGASAQMTPQKCADLVRSFEFSTKRDTSGIAVRLTDEVRNQIHRLARDYDVAAFQVGSALCPDCLEVTT